MARAALRAGAASGVVAAVAAGCGAGGAAKDGEVVVSAAASLEPAFTAYADASRIDARQSFAGSDELAAQIRQGIRPDVYAAASMALVEALHAAGLVAEPVAFASNELVVAVPSDSEIESVAALATPGVTVAIGADGVPVGDYARRALAGLGAAEREAILANVRTFEPDAGGIVGKLIQGAVDAGFVYRTDVVAARGALEAVSLPARLRPEVAYGAAVVVGAEHPRRGREFVDGLLHGAGSEALRAAGFGPPPR